MSARVLSKAGLAAVILCVPVAAASAQTPVEQSYRQARAVLDAALAAAGGEEALRKVKDVSRVGRGTAFNQGQSLEPDAPFTQRDVDVASIVDFPRKWSANESATVTAGNIPTRGRAVLKGDTGFNFNRVTSVLTPLTAGAVATARTSLGRDPVVILLTAAGRAETLRSLGEAPFDGRPHRVITFADSDGAQIALYVDAKTNLVSKLETVADNAVLGDVASEVLYSDYRKVGDVQAPFRVVSKTAGQVTQDLAYSEIKVNAGVADSLFVEPADAVRLSPAAPATVTVTKLGDDLWLMGGGSHNSLVVAFADHVLLVEAPQGVERTQAVLAKIRETVGDKPVRYVVPSHYHFDHSGGLRAAIAAGATVVTTPGNRAFVERMAAAPHTLRPDALSRAPRKPTVETFTAKRVFTDGVRTIELHDVGPSPHVKEMLVAYVPKERVLFVTDIFGVPAEGPIPPAGQSTREFAEKVKKLGLVVDKIAPSHGRVGTMDDLATALAKPEPAP
jgi:glyoxylase-like metal-dependent hydrolase (beta-lactamase superfamily II)